MPANFASLSALAKPGDLIKNQAKDINGNTLSANGGLGVSDKTLSNVLPQNQITKCTVGDLRAKGYDVIASPTVSNPYHVSITTPDGRILTGAEAAPQYRNSSPVAFY